MVSRAPAALKTQNPVAFYVPVALDLSQYPDEWHDSIRYLLNLIHWRHCCCWQADEDGFVSLKYDYLTSVIPKRFWTKMRNRLEDDGVIECDGLSKKGVKAYGYRVLPPFQQTHRVVCTDEAFSRRVLATQRARQAVLLPVHTWLRDNLDRLHFDSSTAHGIISGMHPDPGSPLTTADYRGQIAGACQRLANSDVFLHRDRFGRVHTPVTSLPRELRCCLSVDGQPLVGVDLANSQPLIAGIVARQFFRNRTSKSRLGRIVFSDDKDPYRYREFRDLERKTERILASGSRRNSCAVPYPRQQTRLPRLEPVVIGESVLSEGDRLALESYFVACQHGHLYEMVMCPGDDRPSFKRQFFAEVFFGRNQVESHVKYRFTVFFPPVARMLRQLKEKDYQRSAWLMQSYEATIFIRVIADRIRVERPDLPLYTIHDSFLTIPAGIDYVDGVVRDEFRKIGIRPCLRREP